MELRIFSEGAIYLAQFQFPDIAFETFDKEVGENKAGCMAGNQ